MNLDEEPSHACIKNRVSLPDLFSQTLQRPPVRNFSGRPQESNSNRNLACDNPCRMTGTHYMQSSKTLIKMSLQDIRSPGGCPWVRSRAIAIADPPPRKGPPRACAARIPPVSRPAAPVWPPARGPTQPVAGRCIPAGSRAPQARSAAQTAASYAVSSVNAAPIAATSCIAPGCAGHLAVNGPQRPTQVMGFPLDIAQPTGAVMVRHYQVPHSNGKASHSAPECEDRAH